MHYLALVQSIYRVEKNATYYTALREKQSIEFFNKLCNVKDQGNTNVCHFPPLVDPAVCTWTLDATP